MPFPVEITLTFPSLGATENVSWLNSSTTLLLMWLPPLPVSRIKSSSFPLQVNSITERQIFDKYSVNDTANGVTSSCSSLKVFSFFMVFILLFIS